MSENIHVDDFIDSYDSDPYASWFLNLKRLPATLQYRWVDFIGQYKLFCDYKGVQYRVTGASRLGDVWLTSNFQQSEGYTKRVNINDCSEWAPEPREQQEGG